MSLGFVPERMQPETGRLFCAHPLLEPGKGTDNLLIATEGFQLPVQRSATVVARKKAIARSIG